MTNTLKKLNEIAEALDDINFQINHEEKIMEEELAERLRLGLEGDAAIAHYNEWMDNHNMSHLKVPYLS